MPTNLPLLHPSSLPHSDTLGVPTWLQWLVVAIALAIGGWLVLEARADRRARSEGEPAASEGEEDGPSSRRLVRAKPAAPSQKTSRPAAATRGSLSPPSLLVLVIGVVAGWSAIDRVRAVDALAGFIRTDGAAQVVRLGFCFAALLWVGAALAPVASRGAAVAFGVAGVIGTFLTVPSRWERRLEWWGAGTVLNTWDHRAYWAGGAFALALLALAAGNYRRGAGTVRAAGSAQSAERSV